MAYDSESDIIIMHGGALDPPYNPYGGRIAYNDTWSYDYNTNTWTNITPAISPLGLCDAKMAYDIESDRIIMFGGYHNPWGTPYEDSTGEVYKKDTWAFDYNTNTWENVTPTVSPEPRIDHAIAYDYDTIVIKDCSAAMNEEIHENNLYDMAQIGIKIMLKKEFLQKLELKK